MDIDLVTTAVPPHVEAYVRTNVAGARRWLDEAHGLLAQRPAMVPTPDHMQRAVAAARNAAEHLYDVGQVDEPVEAVREALVAAEAIMTVVRRLEHPRPGMVDVRARAAEQLRDVERTLAGLEREFGLPHLGG